MRISLPKFQCDIVITKADLTPLADFLMKNKGAYTKCLCISDEKIFSLYGSQVQQTIKEYPLAFHPILLASGEISKNLESVSLCWEQMQSCKADRKSLVIGLGGGAITDIA